MNPFRAEGEEDVIWNRGRVLLQAHEEFAYDVIIGVAASGFYGPKDIGFFAFDDIELVRRSVLDSLFIAEFRPLTPTVLLCQLRYVPLVVSTIVRLCLLRLCQNPRRSATLKRPFAGGQRRPVPAASISIGPAEPRLFQGEAWFWTVGLILKN